MGRSLRIEYPGAFYHVKVLPNYRERKEWLRVNGAGLDI